MSPVLFTIFGFNIRYYSLMYIIALLTCIYLAKRMAKEQPTRFPISPAEIESLGYWVIFSAIVGARIYDIVFGDYETTFYDAIAIWKGIRGLSIQGGIIGVAIAIFVFARKKKFRYLMLGDIAGTTAILGQAIGRIGNFMNGEAHGFPTFTPLNVIIKGNFSEWWLGYQQGLYQDVKELVPWGVVFPSGSPAGDEFPNIPVHPTMIYEMILDIVAFLLLYFYFRGKKLAEGSLGAIYLISYGLIRAIVTLFRSDNYLFLGMRLPLFVSLVMVCIGIVLLYVFNKKKVSDR